ncbi:Ribosome biogenesis protein NIP7 [Pseudoloma neurophilia]|uniref:60S ribosome subunit biogenesis protein NIP7 n=1 Tax=Pseudoloma neurophilia TaxID=146866 RepID=A0A0R0LYL6_9MICR|nr:Ribosome biogenesis protein NIP7 [Pseudoloma neurophilia]
MRKLTNEEFKKIEDKLVKIIGNNIKDLFGTYTAFLHLKNVFLLTENEFKKISNIPQKNIILVGKHLGKFTRSDRFFLKISALNILEQYASRKVWIKWSAEMNFLYGNNVSKSHVLKTSEDIGKNEVVFLYNPKDTLLGYGITTRDNRSFEKADHHSSYIIRQCDKGEFLREEQSIL